MGIHVGKYSEKNFLQEVDNLINGVSTAWKIRCIRTVIRPVTLSLLKARVTISTTRCFRKKSATCSFSLKSHKVQHRPSNSVGTPSSPPSPDDKLTSFEGGRARKCVTISNMIWRIVDSSYGKDDDVSSPSSSFCISAEHWVKTVSWIEHEVERHVTEDDMPVAYLFKWKFRKIVRWWSPCVPLSLCSYTVLYNEPTVVNHNVMEVQAVRHVCCAIIMQSACILINRTYVP
jgi:hypothetical protein